MDTLLLIFVRNPILGKAKTRLAATVGAEYALEIYRCLLQYTHKISNELELADKRVYYADFMNDDDLWNGYDKYLQDQEKELGDRMKEAFRKGFEDGYKKVAIIGSDCLELTSNLLQKGFDQLSSDDVVVGPAKDGGYYFMGMNDFYPHIFDDKKWSTDTVFLDTIEDIKREKLSYSLLKTLSDVDTEEDLKNIEWLAEGGGIIKFCEKHFL
ncbi:MAG: glycosyltransferase [Cytophagales bacterium]|nr:glycosyltransferase [Cytophagales bacterium]